MGEGKARHDSMDGGVRVKQDARIEEQLLRVKGLRRDSHRSVTSA